MYSCNNSRCCLTVACCKFPSVKNWQNRRISVKVVTNRVYAEGRRTTNWFEKLAPKTRASYSHHNFDASFSHESRDCQFLASNKTCSISCKKTLTGRNPVASCYELDDYNIHTSSSRELTRASFYMYHQHQERYSDWEVAAIVTRWRLMATKLSAGDMTWTIRADPSTDTDCTECTSHQNTL